jgi:hypothetical protein
MMAWEGGVVVATGKITDPKAIFVNRHWLYEY